MRVFLEKTVDSFLDSDNTKNVTSKIEKSKALTCVQIEKVVTACGKMKSGINVTQERDFQTYSSLVYNQQCAGNVYTIHFVLRNTCVWWEISGKLYLHIITFTMSDDHKIKSRQESTDSLESSTSTTEEYSEDDKDGYDIDDFSILKTIGEKYQKC